MRKQGIKNQSSEKMKTFLDIYLSGYLEIFICTLITFMQVEKQSLNQNSSDMIALGFASFSMLMLLIIPIVVSYFAIQKVCFPMKFNEEKYGFVFEEASTNSLMQALVSVFFMLRRLIFACILYFLSNNIGV